MLLFWGQEGVTCFHETHHETGGHDAAALLAREGSDQEEKGL